MQTNPLNEELPRVDWGEPVDAAPAYDSPGFEPPPLTWADVPAYAALQGRWNVFDMPANIQPGETERAYMLRAKSHALHWAQEDVVMAQAAALANAAAEHKREANRLAQRRWRERKAAETGVATAPAKTTPADVAKAQADLDQALAEKAAAYRAMAEARAQWDRHIAQLRRNLKQAVNGLPK